MNIPKIISYTSALVFGWLLGDLPLQPAMTLGVVGALMAGAAFVAGSQDRRP